MSDVQLFRRLGTIARQAETSVSKLVKIYGLDDKTFIYLMRILEHPQITQTQLCTLVRVDKTTVSRGLARLEKQGYITRFAASDNRRSKHLAPTALAQSHQAALHELERLYVAQSLDGLSQAERRQLNELLGKLVG
ncbi:MarR family winged helix-turn-helix transcriptional regulator [Lacticaseibacillus baoqingensis]|uniref:MarR family winged helix-turn-helix transcriptional regulator n=1 Tax=Lacticaseibacillus baoqingensis TaxID=2486013 RepID=A0ABW4E562_9LACO|nr:MarR family transcriptional regulator [Lacticaseibacillus baoqingensis]